MQAAIYIRWSTEDQGTGTTLEVQRDSCLKYAAAKGWTVAPEHIIIDDGISGAKESRPALNRLNHAIGQGAVSTVIVYKLDRLARSPYLAHKLVEKDWHKKASLVSITEAHIDTTTTTGQLGFGIAAIFAAHERNTIRDRTMSGKRRRAEQGRNPGLRPSYGYAVVNKQYVIVESEAVMVRRIYENYLSGRTVGQIERALDTSGIRTRAGGPWHISAIQRILANAADKGRLVYSDITAHGAFPAIIDAERWEQMQSLRQQKGTSHPRRMAGESPYILSGRLWCETCGRPMNGRVARSGKHENRYYACTGYIQFRDCDCLTVRQDVLEELVVSHLLPLLNETELHSRVTKRIGATIDLLKQEMASLEDRLGGIEQELARIRQDYRKARIDAETFNDLRTDIGAEKSMLSETFARREAELARADFDARTTDHVRRAVELFQVWQDLSYAQRKQVVHLLTERIEWNHQCKQVTVKTMV
ncbi:MAG TPA: recombinase family protein [Symbiobacteriaceae bacterium]|nr:recombinase family protein [Symbiobacteriaceae bacterium]